MSDMPQKPTPPDIVHIVDRQWMDVGAFLGSGLFWGAVIGVVLAALACVRAYGQPLQGEFAPQPPPVIAVPQPPVVYDPPPVLIQQPPRLVPVAPQGQWIRVRRPTGLGQFLFGDMYVFIPAPPPQQPLPPPQPQYDSRQRAIQ